MKRRDIGEYGDGSIGLTGALACTGLMSMKSAPEPAASTSSSRRSP